MPYTRTLAQLRTSVAVRGQYERSSDITPAVLLEVLNDALEETYNISLACDDDYYVKIGSPISVVAGTDTYALATDFYELRKVEILMSGSASDPQARWARLYPVSLDDAHRFRQFGLVNKKYRYRLSNQGLTLVPAPSSADTIRVYYIPLAPQLVSDSDVVTFDRPIEQKLVVQIALRDCLARQDLGTMEIEGKIERLKGEMRSVSDSHDAGEPFYLGSHTDDGECEW